MLWRDVPPPFRSVARWLTIVQVVGYTTALLFVLHTTHMAPSGISDRYRGSDSTAAEGAMQFPKSYAEMLTLTHTHILSMAVIFDVLGPRCSSLLPALAPVEALSDRRAIRGPAGVVQLAVAGTLR